MKTALKKRNKKGFTLVELVIVIAILAILAAVAIPTVTNVIDTANKNADASNCQTLELALKSASAEEAAKTWTPADDTVATALAHEGLNLKTMEDNIKTGTNFYYGTGTSNHGKIYVTNATDTDKLEAGTTLDNYINGVETGSAS